MKENAFQLPRTINFFFALTIAAALMGCQSLTKSKEGLKFFSGKAQVLDKKKNKEEWISFSSAVRYPGQLRMDVYYSMLNVPVGTLVLDGNKATLLSFIDKKAYVTKSGDQVLEKLMKTQMSPADITAVFAEQFPLGRGWICGGAPQTQRCVRSDVQIDWEAQASQERKMKVEGPKSKVSFVYEPETSGNADFDLNIPKNYEVIQL